MTSNIGRKCVDCEYPIEASSPRSNRREPRPLIRLKPRHELDPEFLAVFDAALQTRIECSTWPSWKHGRCNCPVTAPADLVEIASDQYHIRQCEFDE